jgi:hypothetical protein
MHEQKIKRAYNREFLSAMTIYVVMLTVSIRWGRGMEDGVLRTVVLTSPMVGFMLALWAVVRQMRRIDEYVRQTMLENLAIAAGVTAGLSFTYGFLETAGFPKLTMFAVWPVMGAAWGLMTAIRCRMNRDE